MSSYQHLYCQQTHECIEVVACVGNWKGPRIDANALQAFLVYHFLVAPGAPLVTWEDGTISYGRFITDSIEELELQRELAGNPPREKLPVLIWTGQNYRALAGRADGLAAVLSDYEQDGGGLWVRRTADGRLIEPASATRLASPGAPGLY